MAAVEDTCTRRCTPCRHADCATWYAPSTFVRQIWLAKREFGDAMPARW